MVKINKSYILVCGLGFIGSNLVNYLKRKKLPVISITSKKIKNSANNIYINVNPLNKNDLYNKLKKFKLTYVINTYGSIDHSVFGTANEEKIFNEHFIVLKNLAHLSIEKKVKKLIQIGSADEYGKTHKSLINEKDQTSPMTPYAFFKNMGTNYLKNLNDLKVLNCITLRLFTTYGMNQSRSRFIPFVIDNCKKNKKFELTNCNQVRDFIHIDDLTKIIFKVMINKKVLKNNILNVGTSKGIKLKEIVNFIVTQSGGGTPLFGKIKIQNKSYSKILVADSKSLQSYIGKFKFKDLFYQLREII